MKDIQVRNTQPVDVRKYIVDYRAGNAEERARMEAAMETLDLEQIDTAMLFGDSALENVSAVSRQINQRMANETNGAFLSPLNKMMDDFSSLNIEAVQESLNNLIRNGGKVVSRNKGALAVTAGAMLTGQFWAAALPGGWIAAREYIQRRREATTLYNTPELIEQRVIEFIGKMAARRQEMEAAARHTPVMLEGINRLAATNRDSFNDVRYHVSAGREMLRRLQEEDIPALKEALAANPSFENEEKLVKREEFSRALARKQALLELSLSGAVQSTATLAVVREAVSDGAMEIRSILTSEVPLMERSVATAGMALDAYRTTRITEAFRKSVDNLESDTMAIALAAEDAAIKGRFDNPERLQGMIDRITSMKVHLETQQERSRLLDEAVAVKRLELEQATSELLAARNSYTSGRVQLGTSPNPIQISDSAGNDNKEAARRRPPLGLNIG